MSVEFRHAALPNGLTVIAEVDGDAHTAAAGFFVRTGARDESRELMGVSHFLEHMMFKGSERLGAEAVNEAFDSIGADHNAFTSSELTAFHAHVLPDRFDEAVDTLAEIMRPALRTADFDEEKGVILEEIAMYEDNPFWRLYEAAMDRYYGDHPLGHRVLGTRDTITALSRDSMREYFEHRYSADNTVVAAAGRVDFDALVARIGERCGSWKRTGAVRTHRPFEPRALLLRDRHPSAHRSYLMFAAPAPPFEDPRRYAAAVAMQILGDGEGSRFHWALVDTGIAEEADASYDPRDGLGLFMMNAACPTDAADEVERIVREQITALRDSLDEGDLLRAKRKIATAIALAGERPAGRMQRIGVLWTMRGMHRTLEQETEEIERLALDDLRSCLDAFPPAPLLAARLEPEQTSR
ncbi:MAG: insulinase family protein [Phycisphaerae bacterium]|nr:insulinase family protein [Phycisphaerae bacterium]